MKCGRCGRELDGNGRCGYCGAEAQASPSPVRVLSREEKAFYDGITIDETADGTVEDRPHFDRQDGPGNIRVRYVHLGRGSRNWLQWAAGGIFVAVLLAFLLFVALPVALVLAAAVALVWYFRGR